MLARCQGTLGHGGDVVPRKKHNNKQSFLSRSSLDGSFFCYVNLQKNVLLITCKVPRVLKLYRGVSCKRGSDLFSIIFWYKIGKGKTQDFLQVLKRS